MTNASQIILYQSPDGTTKLEVQIEGETVWLTQKKLADLFVVGIPAINKHLNNIFESGELIEKSVISKMETTAVDGKKYKTNFYNLDAIIAVGYRVNSLRATQFRIWATQNWFNSENKEANNLSRELFTSQILEAMDIYQKQPLRMDVPSLWQQ